MEPAAELTVEKASRQGGKPAGKKSWSELSPRQRGLVIGGAMVQLTLLVIAQRDLSVRPAQQIRGPKWVWRLVTLINFAGPVAYFAVGIRRGGPAEVVGMREASAV